MVGLARALLSGPTMLILGDRRRKASARRRGLEKGKASNARGVPILMVEQKARQCLAMGGYAYLLE